MRPARHVIALLLACLGWGGAQAQPIYRCGDSYSQQPCDGGRQLLPAAPAPSATDRSQAAAMAARDARLADSLERDRTRREAQGGNALTVLPTAQAEPLEPHKWPEKAGTRKLDVFTASAPGSRPPKAKAGKKDKPASKDKAADKDAADGSGKKAAAAASGKSQVRSVQPVKTATAARP